MKRFVMFSLVAMCAFIASEASAQCVGCASSAPTFGQAPVSYNVPATYYQPTYSSGFQSTPVYNSTGCGSCGSGCNAQISGCGSTFTSGCGSSNCGSSSCGSFTSSSCGNISYPVNTGCISSGCGQAAYSTGCTSGCGNSYSTGCGNGCSTGCGNGYSTGCTSGCTSGCGPWVQSNGCSGAGCGGSAVVPSEASSSDTGEVSPPVPTGDSDAAVEEAPTAEEAATPATDET